jgi:hypothetical protein
MTEPTPPPPEDPGLLALLLGTVADIRTLFSTEIQLATAEVRYNVGRLALAFAIILAGGIIMGVAGIALLGALVAALSPSFGPVISSLITAAVAVITGGGLMVAGITKMRTGPLAPKRAIANLTSYANSLSPARKQENADESRNH